MNSGATKCFSAGVGFAATAVLIPTGVASMAQARKARPHYVAIGTLPLLFGLQQAAEGAVWLAGAHGPARLINEFSLAYMFFTWLAWPVWIPVATYFVEPFRRWPLYLLFIVMGSHAVFSLFCAPRLADGSVSSTCHSL